MGIQQRGVGTVDTSSPPHDEGAWATQHDDILRSVGKSSARLAVPLQQFAFPAMENLLEMVSGPAPVMLDVGVGVGELAVECCRLFPTLRVVGLDIVPRVLELARSTVGRAGMGGRIELRLQDVAVIEDREVFCLAWLPAVFVPRAAVVAGLPRLMTALVPGGWLVLGHSKEGFGGPSTESMPLHGVALGGATIDGHEARAMLTSAGLDSVRTLATGDGGPGITVGRRPIRR